jgi:glycosyltransferase involved in cell wall biosynthesis
MKVLALTNLYPTPWEPTRGIFNYQTFQALSRHCEMQVVVPLKWWLCPPAINGFKVHRENSSGLEAHFTVYPSVPRMTWQHANGMAFSLRPYLQRLRREFPFDAILAAWAYPDGVAAARLADAFQCPLLMKIHGSDMNEVAQQPRIRKQVRWGLDRSQQIVTVSHALRRKVIEMGIDPEKVTTLHNGVDQQRFHPMDRQQVRAKLGLPLDRLLIGYVGNFVPEKGVDVLLEAMGQMYQAGMRQHDLVLIGSGSLEESVRAQARALHLEDRVHLCGARPHVEIPDWIGAFDLLCLPSHREGCPNVILEALASGRPVVASRVGGVPELLSDQTGITVPPGDPASLAQGLEEALRRTWSPEKLRSAVHHLSWEAVGRTFRDYLAASLRSPKVLA